MRVAVLGGNGQLRREVVRALVTRGYTVAAVVRHPAVALVPASVEVRMADARDRIAGKQLFLQYLSARRLRGRLSRACFRSGPFRGGEAK
jgi:uncharacterized protein YbjT (DUF2867 family)